MSEAEFPSCNDDQSACALCGLSLRRGRVSAAFAGKTYCFCCPGRRQVYAILLEASDAGDPANFKTTGLYKECLAAGILPASVADLERMEQRPSGPPGPDGGLPPQGEAASSDAILPLDLKVTNMWCPACAWLIDTALKKLPGVVDSRCDFSTDRLGVRYNPVRTSPDRICAEIAKLGYRTAEPGRDRSVQAQKKDFIRFGICSFLTMNVMMLSFALYSGFLIELTPDNIAKISWPMMAMTAAVLVYGGFDLFRKGFFAVRNQSANMETLIAIGACSAFGLSLFNQLAGSLHTYYDTAAMLITLVLLGKTLESRTKRRVLEDLDRFFALMPGKVRVCSNQHPFGRYTAVAYLAPGDTFRVESDEVVPADGRILSGSGTVDESALTGEPVPVVKSPGDAVRSGVRIRRGDFTIEARQVGEDSTLGQMIAIIEKTLLAKTPLEGKTDFMLKWFVPAVLALAAATGAVCRLAGDSITDAVLRAVTVTVISCPCALGVAIPLARAAGVSLAGKKGMLVRDFSAFEAAEKIDTVVFDKTGTITRGQWDLKRIHPMAGFSEAQVLALAAGIESGCDHFIGIELTRQASARGIEPLPVRGIRSVDGGLEGRLEGRPVRIGSAGYLADVFKNNAQRLGTEDAADGARHSRVYLSCDTKPAAVFIFGDQLRPGMVDAVEDLKKRGLRLAVVSGDGEAVTLAVAASIGISDATGGRLPAEKAAYIADLQADGRCVAMVGDGINDAPAMVRADLAIAVHAGGSLAREAAQISFMRGAPDLLPAFLDFAGQVNRKIRQNLLFTFLYNAIAIPMAMSGLLNPLIAVSAMLLSSISVTVNTLFLVKRSQ